MMEMHAQSILAILAMDVFTPTNQLMIITLAPKIIVIPLLEISITIQSAVMTTIHAILILAILLRDAFTLQLILQQRMLKAQTNV
jgi:hypothetical protein